MPPVQAVAKKRGTRRWILAVAALLMLSVAVVAPPLISLNRMHRRIADSISQSIGRPVRMSSIKLRLLPRPGFEIADFVVEDDPAFGAEPILRSSQVVASVRLLPLWRGRLEIARIAFDEPSLNLIRNRQGRWNFDSLLSQAAQIPKAPTGERHPRGLPRFPYIDASNARINFKSGDEKLPFSFFNADLAVWLANPGEWRIEFAAQPVRTDLTLDLANTGTVRLDGSLHHAATLSQMPMNLRAEWSNAPLGQLSKILTGTDAGWRGQLDVIADLTGSMDQTALKLTASGQSIHRVEFDLHEPLNVNVTCQAKFTRADRLFDAVTCLAPTGDGHLLLTGSIHTIAANPDPELSLELNNVPVAWALNGVRLVRAGFGSSLIATGTIDGNFAYSSPDSKSAASANPELGGQATVNQLTIAGPALQKPLALPMLRLAMKSGSPPQIHRVHGVPAPAVDSNELLLEPFVVGSSPVQAAATPAAKLPASMTVSGAFARNGFSVHLGGESNLGELITLGKEIGLLQRIPANVGNQGTADLDLTVHGPWMLPITDQPVAPAAVDGTLRLHNAQLSGDFLTQPVRIPAAQAAFAGNEITWTASGMIYGPLHADGTLSYPAFCRMPTGCVHHFGLHLATLDAQTAQNAILGAERHGELIERLLNRLRSLNRSTPSWPTLTGSVQIGTLTIESLALKDFTSVVAVEGHTVQLKSSTAHALDGQLHISGAMEVTDHTPHYQLEAQLDDATARSTAALFAENWGPGSINLRTSLKFSGFEQKDLLSSATGTFHWEWTNGGLPGSPPVSGKTGTSISGPVSRFDTWTADGLIADGALNLQKSQILRGNDITPLTGTISYSRELSLSLDTKEDTTDPVKITGTLQHPLVQAEPITTADSATP
jgi:hypothetical protein